MQEYALAAGALILTGRYAVMRSERHKKHAQVVYLRDGGERRRPLVPDVVSFARYLDLYNRDAGFHSLSILHYWVTADLQTEHRADRAFAVDVLEGVAAMLTGKAFPVPGEQCTACVTQGCRPDLHRQGELVVGADATGLLPSV